MIIETMDIDIQKEIHLLWHLGIMNKWILVKNTIARTVNFNYQG